MKQTDILKMLAKDMNAASSTLNDVNQALKAKQAPQIKYRLSGIELGHYGFTGLIKAVTDQGIKVYDVNKVRLIPFSAIESMEKAKPREKRPERKAQPTTAQPLAAAAKPGKVAKPAKAKKLDLEDDDDDFDDDYEDDFEPVKRKKSAKSSGHAGSKYIPRK